MLPQGVLSFQYEADRSERGLTSLAGLPVYLDLVQASGLGAAIREHVRVAGGQGWLDIQMVLAVVFLNLAGGDCVEDLERLGECGADAVIIGKALYERKFTLAQALETAGRYPSRLEPTP